METDKQKMEASIRDFIERLDEFGKGDFYEHIYSHFYDCDPLEKSVTLGYDLPKWCSNYGGVVHGGMVASVMDQCMGILVYWCDGQTVAKTINMQVSYVRPVPLDSRLIIKATLSNCGRTMANVTARAWLEGQDESRTITTAVGCYYVKV